MTKIVFVPYFTRKLSLPQEAVFEVKIYGYTLKAKEVFILLIAFIYARVNT